MAAAHAARPPRARKPRLQRAAPSPPARLPAHRALSRGAVPASSSNRKRGVPPGAAAKEPQ